jgi:hypothetical protein
MASSEEHFSEEPVVAPHSRFHPVPTRPVFSPPPAEELAALFAPPPAESATKADSSASPATEKPADAAPSDDAVLEDDRIQDDGPSSSATESIDTESLDTENLDDVEQSAPMETLPPPDEAPTRTARRSRQVSSAAKATEATEASRSDESDESDNRPVIQSTFGPVEQDAPMPGESIETGTDVDGPLLWRALRTPAGSLRAVPADSELFL